MRSVVRDKLSRLLGNVIIKKGDIETGTPRILWIERGLVVGVRANGKERVWMMVSECK